MNTHEDFSRGDELSVSSDRTFGIVIAVFFLLITFLPLLRSHSPRWWCAGVSAALILVAWLQPQALHLPNVLWTRLALLLNKIVNPIVTGVMFYVVFTPAGYLMRLAGKDPLRLRFEPNEKSYWIERRPPGPPPNTMAQQF